MRSVGRFIIEWFREWWALMGCAAFTFLGIYIAAANKSNAWVVWCSVVLGSILFFTASYRAWKRQYDVRVKYELELNSVADMRGRIWIDPRAPRSHAGESEFSSILDYHCDCTNHGRKTCQISKAVIRIKFPQDIERELIQDFYDPGVKEVSYGQRFDYWGRYCFVDIAPDELKGTAITVNLIDSLGVEYRNTETVRKVSN